MYRGESIPSTPVDIASDKLIDRLAGDIVSGTVSRGAAENIVSDMRDKLETDYLLHRGIFAS